MRLKTLTLSFLAVVVLVSPRPCEGQLPPFTEHISVSFEGQGGNGTSRDVAINADGRFVVFMSGANNLVVDDYNELPDVFVRDRRQGLTEKIPLPAGVNSPNGRPSISADGRFVGFAANGPEPDVASIMTHVYLHDRLSGSTERISITPDNLLQSYGPAISDDGTAVAYFIRTSAPDTAINGILDVLVYHRDTGLTVIANRTNDGKVISSHFDPDLGLAISGDGRTIAFTFPPALVPGPSTPQVYVRNLAAGTTIVASANSAGIPSDDFHFDGPDISGDGRLIAFSSPSALVASDTNGAPDIYVRDMSAHTIERVSVDNAGNQGAGFSFEAALSADGRFVAFTSGDSALVPGDTNETLDVFVRDRVNETTQRVSIGVNGEEPNNFSFGPALSADGHSVAFTSYASNLAPIHNFGNDLGDVYVREWPKGSVLTLSEIVPSTAQLWPPNGQLVNVRLNYTVSDGSEPNCTVTVTSDEPQATSGRGQNAAWHVVDAHNLQLRAARAGSDDGRIYTVTVLCVDALGSSISRSTQISVPHDQRR